MKTIQVTIKTDHYRRAKSYIDFNSCPLAVALKEQHPGIDIQVGGSYAKIGGVKYSFNISEWGSFTSKASAIEIERRCRTVDEEFEPITLTLTQDDKGTI